MKILIKQFLGARHSWSICGWGLARSAKKLGHQVHLFATDGIEHLPNDLKENLIGYTELDRQKVYGRLPDKEYDCQISYTAMKNFPFMLANGKKNRFGVWVYEWDTIPTGFARHYQSCDLLCPPSNFGKQAFLKAGIPENRIKVIPHGINRQEFEQTSTISLGTKASFKILTVLAQNHLRKNIPGMLEAYGKAFTNKDDVCLILKAKDKPVKSQFEISLKNCLIDFNRKFPKHAELKLMPEFIEDMSALYRSVDAVYSASYCEGFYFPGLEAIASGKINIIPNHGGQLDFLNENNSLLISGKEVRADPKAMYWQSSNSASWFKSDINDAVDKLKFASNNFEKLNKNVEKQRINVYNKYDWNIIFTQFVDELKI